MSKYCKSEIGVLSLFQMVNVQILKSNNFSYKNHDSRFIAKLRIIANDGIYGFQKKISKTIILRT